MKNLFYRLLGMKWNQKLPDPDSFGEREKTNQSSAGLGTMWFSGLVSGLLFSPNDGSNYIPRVMTLIKWLINNKKGCIHKPFKHM